MASSSGLSLAWSGDFDSLKEFLCKVCDFVGNWSQPGGDKKVFSFDDGSSISWRKSKKVLSFNGPRASQLMRDLCKRLSEQEANTSVFADEYSAENEGQSSKSVNIDMEIDDLKAGQMQNGEAIKALSDSILGILPVISEFQAFMDKRVARSDETFAGKSPDGVADRANVCFDKSDDANTNSGAALHGRLNRSTIHVDNDEFNDSDALEKNSTDVRDDEVIFQQCIVSDKPAMTYADVVQSKPKPFFDESIKPETVRNSELGKSDASLNVSADEFIGVQRKHRKIKKFFLSGIASNVNEHQIISYLEKRKVKPTHLVLFKSKRKGTLSAKIHIPTAYCCLIQDKTFWPEFISCKPWQANDHEKQNSERRRLAPKKGNYETYV